MPLLSAHLPLALAAPVAPGFGPMVLGLGLIGILVVALIGLVAYCLKALGGLRARLDVLEAARLAIAVAPVAPAVVAAPKAAPVAAAVAAVPAGPSPEILFVIAASVHAVLRGRHRIVALQPAFDARAWSIEGRRQVFQSHQVR